MTHTRHWAIKPAAARTSACAFEPHGVRFTLVMGAWVLARAWVTAGCAVVVSVAFAPVAGATTIDSFVIRRNHVEWMDGTTTLRLVDGGQAELIWYDRADEKGIRGSAYSRTPITDPTGLRAVLATAVGMRGEVRKVRELWLWHNVRIHLDEVAHLGTFVEFEAVIDEGNDEAILRWNTCARILSRDEHIGPRAEEPVTPGSE